MNATLFTLEEANRILPLVRAVTGDAVRRYRALKAEIRVIERLKALRGAAAGGLESDVAERDRRVEAHLEELRRLLDELEGLGCHLRDYERGVVDFPAACMDADRFAFYCWVLGEKRIRHWYAEGESFAQRRPVGATASA